MIEKLAVSDCANNYSEHKNEDCPFDDVDFDKNKSEHRKICTECWVERLKMDLEEMGEL